MFVRRKFQKGKAYFYLVESYRDDDGKIKQRQVEYFGDYDNAIAATASRPHLREQVVKEITVRAQKPTVLPKTEEEKLRQANQRLQAEIDRLLSVEYKRQITLEMLRAFCEEEDKKPFCGGIKPTEPGWVMIHEKKPSSRWSKMAKFRQWLDTVK